MQGPVTRWLGNRTSANLNQYWTQNCTVVNCKSQCHTDSNDVEVPAVFRHAMSWILQTLKSVRYQKQNLDVEGGIQLAQIASTNICCNSPTIKLRGQHSPLIFVIPLPLCSCVHCHRLSFSPGKHIALCCQDSSWNQGDLKPDSVLDHLIGAFLLLVQSPEVQGCLLAIVTTFCSGMHVG